MGRAAKKIAKASWQRSLVRALGAFMLGVLAMIFVLKVSRRSFSLAEGRNRTLGAQGAGKSTVSNDPNCRAWRIDLGPGARRRRRPCLACPVRGFAQRPIRSAAAAGPHETEYYRDFFARDQGLNFGHTTETSYALIAANAADQIEKSWPEIESRIRRARKARAR